MEGTSAKLEGTSAKLESPSAGERRRVVRNDTLKWILSEVLRDMRQNDRCWIKYEVHQGCFHITAK